MATGISDIGAKVWIWDETVYKVLVPVSEIGEVGGSMDKHESTTLDDPVKTYEAGRRDTNEVEFTYNYTEANATAVKAVMDGKTEQKLLIVYGDGSGYLVVGVGTDTTSALSVNSLHKASFTFILSEQETHKTATEITDLLPN